MRITPDWLRDSPASKVMAALKSEGIEAFYVGGCVRDSLIGVTAKDIDIATSARPEDVTFILEARGIEVYPTGVAHGTVTAGCGGQAFEITTYRRDVTTDGRNATVAYSTSMHEDAQRRDLTINALYMNEAGGVLDPVGTGILDLMQRRVRFVGDAVTRCQEDYLRVLRYFRFAARFGQGAVDEAADAAVRQCWPKVFEVVSKERIWWELKSLMALQDPFPALVRMEAIGLLGGLLGEHHIDPEVVHSLRRVERVLGLDPTWQRTFAALDGAYERYPCSRAEARHLDAIQTRGLRGASPAKRAFEVGVEAARDHYVVCMARNMQTPMERAELEVRLKRGGEAKLPVNGNDLIREAGHAPGPNLGWALDQVRSDFCASNFTASREELMRRAVARAMS